MDPRNFLAELKRRNVYKVAVVYAIVGWLLIQVATQVFPFFEIPNWSVRLLVVLLLFGFPIALVLAWAFELTPEGIKRAEDVAPSESITHRTGTKLTALIVFVALIALGLLLLQLTRHKPAVATGNSLLPSAVSQSGAPGLPEKSIAVLPFQNLSKDEENAFFADGVQDQILTDLAKVADLKVISRTSVMQYKNVATRNLREIAQQLGVAHVLEGSVQRAGGKVRVTAQLINARTDGHEWAENYDRPVDDVFAIQSEIAKSIADQLQAQISPREKADMSQAPTQDLEANKLYLQAKELEAASFADLNSRQELLQAARLLDEAVARDPNFALAYCLLSSVHLQLYFDGGDHTPARRELANAALQKASRLQPDAGEVRLALARYAYHGFADYDRARAELDVARDTLPNNAGLYLLTAFIDRRQGRWTDAMRNFEHAFELDPRNVSFLDKEAETYQYLRRYSESNRVIERALVIAPRDSSVRITLGRNSFLGRADTRLWRTQLTRILNEDPAAARFASDLICCALAERDAAAAARALTAIPPGGTMETGDFFMPPEWFAGLVARTFGDAAAAQTALSAARTSVEKVVRDQPDYGSAWSALGLIDAGLGRKEDAVGEGRRACALLPTSKDAMRATQFITNLAQIYVWTAEKDLAIEQLAISAELPNGITYGELKLYSQWDSLRGDPRFEKIVASLAPKDAK